MKLVLLEVMVEPIEEAGHVLTPVGVDQREETVADVPLG